MKCCKDQQWGLYIQQKLNPDQIDLLTFELTKNYAFTRTQVEHILYPDKTDYMIYNDTRYGTIQLMNFLLENNIASEVKMIL